MLKSEAEQQILRQWEIWSFSNVPAGKKAKGAEALMFYGDIATNHPALLTFQSPGDKWQVIHGWLLQHGKVTD